MAASISQPFGDFSGRQPCPSWFTEYYSRSGRELPVFPAESVELLSLVPPRGQVDFPRNWRPTRGRLRRLRTFRQRRPLPPLDSGHVPRPLAGLLELVGEEGPGAFQETQANLPTSEA